MDGRGTHDRHRSADMNVCHYVYTHAHIVIISVRPGPAYGWTWHPRYPTYQLKGIIVATHTW